MHRAPVLLFPEAAGVAAVSFVDVELSAAVWVDAKERTKHFKLIELIQCFQN